MDRGELDASPDFADLNFVEVARIEHMALVRVTGLGNMVNAVPLAEFFISSLGTGLLRFVVDLERCMGMDSTFIGTLVWAATGAKDKGDGWVCIVNASAENVELLEILGADRFLRFKREMPELTELETHRLDSSVVDKHRRIELVRAAHEKLVEIDKHNRERFGGFLERLAAELDR